MTHISKIDKCCIYNFLLLVLSPVAIQRETIWQLDECEKIIAEYNKKKHKDNKINLPWALESTIYLLIANNFREHSSDKYNEWLWKAYYNSNSDIEMQEKIKECIDNAESKIDTQLIISKIFNNFIKED